MKNYIGFVNDHSGSMGSLKYAAIKDYNTNIVAVKEAASREMLDTVVSVLGVGIGKPKGNITRYRGNEGYGVEHQVVISNPHVLKPVTSWSTNGGTPLYDGIGEMIELMSSLPDANKEDVSFLIMITTDGEEAHSSSFTADKIHNLITQYQRTGRWTFVFRIPKGQRHTVTNLGVPSDNIQEWDTTQAGMAASTVVNTQAMDNYFAQRTAGKKSSGSFYSDASKVDVSALQQIDPKEVSLYVVDPADQGIWIRDFILKHRMQYLKGAAFYQLTKTEAKVSHTKLFVIRDRNTGKLFTGPEARQMIGLPTDRNARLHPGDHDKYDIFIQSESINRKLVGGTGVVYWPKLGTEFTQAEIEKFTGTAQPKPMIPAPVVLPAVKGRTTPTKSPIPVTPRVTYYETRGEARGIARALGKKQSAVKSLPKQDQHGQKIQKPWYVE